MEKEHLIDYTYCSEKSSHTHAYLWNPVISQLEQTGKTGEIFDLGCGNGAFGRHLEALGFDVTGVDPSEAGISIARKSVGLGRYEVGSAYEDLAARFGQFPALVSLEVVEHVYDPRAYAKCVHDLLNPGGIAIVSTPYHGYLKNLALAISGRMDSHFTALWDHGHIKFWSIRTLTQLFSEQGMSTEKVLRTGRIPILGKSMVFVLRKSS